MKKILLFIAVILLTATACNATSGSGEAINVIDPWGRTSPSVAANGAFYMMLSNNGDSDDRLLKATTEACTTAELHEMFDKGNGVMGMRPVEGGAILVPAGGNAELKPGGMHIMCLGKQGDFESGREIPITLTFENAGEVQVTAVIRDN